MTFYLAAAVKKIAFICLFGITTRMMAGTDEGRQRTARDLWEKMLQAKGVRRSPLRTFVLSLRATSGSAFQNDNAGKERTTLVSSPPDEWWIFDDYRPGKLGARASVYDLKSERAWIAWAHASNFPQPTNPNTPGELQRRERILATFFCQAPGFTPKLLEAKTRVRQGFHTYDVVNTSWNDQLTYYLDPSTHLPEKLEILIKGTTTVPAYGERPAKTIFYSDVMAVVMEDYHDVAGSQVPARVKMTDSWYDVSVQINVDLPRDLFRNPPIGVTSGEDWKRQNSAIPRATPP